MMDDVDDFLAHYGVKGMQWGVSRAVTKIQNKRAAVKQERKEIRDKARAGGYSDRMRNYDSRSFGENFARKMDKRVAKGEKPSTAYLKQVGINASKGAAVVTALLYGPKAISAASRGLSTLASNINAKRGAEAAAKLFADSKGLTSYSTISLAFDAATNKWK